MHIKTTLRFHLISSEWQRVMEQPRTINAGRDVEKRELSIIVGIVHLLWKPVWRILKKLKINIPYEPGIGLNIILHKLTQPCPLLLSLNPYCWRHHAFTTLSWLWSESFLPWGLDFMVSESTMQVLIFLWSYDAYNLHCDHPGAMSLKVQQWHA